MNDTTHTANRPEVEAFLTAVRARLADLSEEEREELLGGLEADLSDQVGDGADLGDPAQYAAELRAAAGLPERATGRSRRLRRRPQLPTPAAIEGRLDSARAAYLEWVAGHRVTRETWQILEPLRPAWWVLRGWVAVTLLDQLAGPSELVTVIPSFNGPLIGHVLLLLAVVVSVLLGQGRLGLRGGPGSPPRKRLGVLVINAGALVALVFVGANLPSSQDLQETNTWAVWDDAYRTGYQDGRGIRDQPGLRLDGDPVRNLFAYDSQGRPIDGGVQLFATDGRALEIDAGTAHHGRRDERTVGCGWRNGSSQLFNVFPLPQRSQKRGTCLDDRFESGPVTAPVAPFAQVPPVTSPVPVAAAPTPDPQQQAAPDATDKPDPGGRD